MNMKTNKYILIRRLEVVLTKTKLQQSGLWPRDSFTQYSFTAVTDKVMLSSDKKLHIKKSITR